MPFLRVLRSSFRAEPPIIFVHVGYKDKEVRAMTKQCCVCKKVERDGAWKRQRDLILSNVSHTYCPVCLAATMQSMRAEIAEADRRAPLAAVS